MMQGGRSSGSAKEQAPRWLEPNMLPCFPTTPTANRFHIMAKPTGIASRLLPFANMDFQSNVALSKSFQSHVTQAGNIFDGYVNLAHRTYSKRHRSIAIYH